MPKQSSSQWDFGGELFPVEATRRVFGVAELTVEIRRLLERHVGEIWISGEISNIRTQSSGHIYFTLKDSAAQLSCIVFRSEAVANRDALQDGRKVILKGQMSVYEARGQYQLQVLAVELQGVGALQAQFEKLKMKLAAEGLFGQDRKRPLPPFPAVVGLVTSPTGAAIRDVLHVVQRRNPALRLILAPCAVQGPGAAGEVAAAIRLLNESPEKVDVILVTRGGGSLEDLWAFNEEVVARAIFHSAAPVVSAVGHEIDFSIADFVADVRAATPSAAAEILTEGVFAGCRWMAQVGDRMREAARRRLAAERRHGQQLNLRLQSQSPRRKLNDRWQRLDEVRASLGRCVRHDAAKLRDRLGAARERLARLRPERLLAPRRELAAQLERALREAARHRLQTWRRRHEALASQLRLLGPEQILARGYSLTTDAATGQVIRRSDETHPGQKLQTRLSAGQVKSVVEPA
ncbi:MAG TPA: exodeoxyribonuclease VII large subunit [Verrucomicrobiae bacterium]|jgi:exodeoxyribonuclease VII large subunit|nr:exodeoxyribonuclease VII large subunit [Verrucomicrobiae bacterium]